MESELYSLSNDKLQQLKPQAFKKEKEMQSLVEKNLQEMLGYTFLSTEFIIGNFRFDTLAFDKENKSFIIIEYKRSENEGLVDQGYSYLAAILDRKADAVLLYNEKTGETKRIKDFDWSQTRVVFISPSFSKYQLESTVFENLPFYMYELKKFGNILQLTKIDNTKRNLRLEKPIISTPGEDITKEISVQTEDDIIPIDSTFREVYEELRDRILSLSGVSIEPKKAIVFKRNGHRFATIEKPQKKKFDLCIIDAKDKMDDPYKLCKDMRSWAWGKLCWRIEIDEHSDLDKVILLVKQAHNSVF